MAYRKQGVWLGMRWYYQEGIDLSGARETSEVAAEAEEDRLEEKRGGG